MAPTLAPFAHADDIHTVTSSLPLLQQQIHVVQNFAKENPLALKSAKCEVLIVSPSGCVQLKSMIKSCNKLNTTV